MRDEFRKHNLQKLFKEHNLSAELQYVEGFHNPTLHFTQLKLSF
jgi:hypothetical protein